tara:strand:- start:365 stop:3328 length:2964 start_codon:yes stop_codon:yes gene_type:complete
MAEESLFNQGVPFAAGVSGGLNPYAGVQRELARADQKKAEGEERAFKLAGLIKQADPSELFGKHYSIANQWASSLFDQVGDYSKSSAKSMEFLAQANALVGYINSKKQYKATNMGDPNDDLTTPSYYARVKRQASGVNAFEANDKKEVDKDFDSVLSNLNKPIQAFSLGENGPMIDDGDGFVSLAEYQDPDAPFMFELEDDLDMLLPGEWYEGWAKTRGKITDGSADAAKRFFEEKVASGDVNIRKLMNWWKGVSDSEKSLDDLVADTTGSVARAVDEYGNLVAQKWKDLNEDGEAQEAAQMFSTGEASFDRELKYTEGAAIRTSEMLDVLGAVGPGNLLDGQGGGDLGASIGASPKEYLGFENLMLLNGDEDSDFVITSQEAGDLTDQQVIDAVNVDSKGDIHVRLRTVGPVLDDDGIEQYGADGKVKTEVKDEFVVYSPDDENGRAMFNSIKRHLEEASGVNHYARLFSESMRRGAAERRRATKQAIIDAQNRSISEREAAAADTNVDATTTTPEESSDDAAEEATSNISREARPPVVAQDQEALSNISQSLTAAGQRPGQRRVGILGAEDMTAYKMPDGMPRASHFNDAVESLLGANYSHREIVEAYEDPRFANTLMASGYDSDKKFADKGFFGGIADLFSTPTEITVPVKGEDGTFMPGSAEIPAIGGGSKYSQEVSKVEATLKSIMDDRAQTQAASGPIGPEPMDPALAVETPTERDFSGLPEISNVSASASRGVALSEGYSSDMSINVPGGNSGVTVGGIDIGSVAGNEDIKLKILKPFVSQEDYKALEGLAGLIGDEAAAGLKAAQAKGLLDPKTLISSDADLQSIISYGIESFVLPSIYKHIPKEDFESLPSAVTDVLINVQFMTPGEEVLKAAVKANKKDRKNAWLKVADLYYKPVVERDSMEQEKDDLLKYTDNDDLLSVDAPYKSTYYGDAKKTDTKLDNYKNKKEGKKILPGNVKRVLEARWQLLDWINSKYGNE